MGHVLEANTYQRLYGVTVWNKSSGAHCLTDTLGNFSLPAHEGDVVRFSFVGFKEQMFIMPKVEVYLHKQVVLETNSTVLQEFSFKRSRLGQYQIDSLERRELYKLPLGRSKPSAIASPVSAVAELFSKKVKRIYAFQKEFERGEKELFLDIKYPPTLVTKMTGLTGDSIHLFMQRYPIDYEFARSATDLEIKMWVRNNYKQWLKANQDSLNKPK